MFHTMCFLLGDHATGERKKHERISALPSSHWTVRRKAVGYQGRMCWFDLNQYVDLKLTKIMALPPTNMCGQNAGGSL